MYMIVVDGDVGAWNDAFASVTVPTIVPVVTCAAMGVVHTDAITANTAAKRCRFIMAAPPLNQPGLR
jgi:hypothetical protein